MAELDFHIVKKLRERISQAGTGTALKYYADAQWQDISWQAFGKEVDLVSLALLKLGIATQDKVGIFASNMPEWTIADLATLQVRAVTVPIYPTNTLEQTRFIVNNADMRVLFVAGEKQLSIATELFNQCETLELIVVMGTCDVQSALPYVMSWRSFIANANHDHSEELTKRINEANVDDLFTLIYTSGTTGQPKGVMLTHANLAAQMSSHDQRLNVTQADVSLCFLPLSHVFERAWSFYVLYKGATNCYLHDVKMVREALQQVRPTLMCAVPRFYEKIFAAVHEKVASASVMKKILFTWAVNMGAKRAQCRAESKSPSAILNLSYHWADKLVLKKLRDLLGGRLTLMPCGGAKLDPTIGRFFHSLGINVKVGYGMTETTATVSCWEDFTFDPNSIGQLMPGVEVRIGDENEILVKGPMVMKGYYKLERETEQAFDAEGYLKTGDAGYLDEHGHLFITDRIKELMKTSGGKYIAPQVIEGTIGKDHFIEQIAVIADTRKFVSALIVPCYDTLESYARQLNIKYHDRLELLKDSQIVEMFEKRINELQQELPSFEQVKRFKLLPKAFSMDDGELTPTLKLRRKIIHTKYEDEIEEMYRE
ncbi:AMP-dependent synthetase/ligase [Vibrio porteresiae]|uniref:Long-chain fatty acid--CoA ligase n=1 Tax=Vibrio porteresiae DSM 19223 TaxID=1123496 RepID=A0ABZ0QCW8_9VIBR|nr:long-chain fatty acid--CoA ligase [Vibrio porteresiae]WPC73740.1 long-chain fatty acid--CoA ligase [Vibrio porteresiae DSM 19223]